MKIIREDVIKILKKYGDLQANLKSENAQKQITKEIVAVFVKNIYGENND